MGDTATLTEPVMATEGRQLRLRGWGVVLLTAAALLVYQTLGTWSVGAGLGGEDADGHWLDANGQVTSIAPPVVDVVGHPAPIAVLLIVLAGAIGLFVPPTLARGGRDRAGVLVRRVAMIALPVLVGLAFVVFTLWQQHAVGSALIDHHQLHPRVFPLGGTTVTISHMTR